jgi:hypothetical protein
MGWGFTKEQLINDELNDPVVSLRHINTNYLALTHLVFMDV